MMGAHVTVAAVRGWEGSEVTGRETSEETTSRSTGGRDHRVHADTLCQARRWPGLPSGGRRRLERPGSPPRSSGHVKSGAERATCGPCSGAAS